MTRTLLFDADIMAYRASSATEKVYLWDGPGTEPSIAEHLEEALQVAQNDIERISDNLKASKVIVCLTDDVNQETGKVNNFRCDVYPQYKQKRLATRRPSTLKRVKDFYAQHYEVYLRPRLEADDCLGILSTHKTLVPGEKVIVSNDKDLQTIPGLLFNPAKDRKPRRITELEADRFFMFQTLVGDTTDGYPGCFGIGPKSKYVERLAECDSLAAMWAVVVEAYASKGRGVDEALVQARCARILRASDWDFQTKTVRLWNPPVESRG